jgi:hypothetical protein
MIVFIGPLLASPGATTPLSAIAFALLSLRLNLIQNGLVLQLPLSLLLFPALLFCEVALGLDVGVLQKHLIRPHVVELVAGPRNQVAVPVEGLKALYRLALILYVEEDLVFFRVGPSVFNILRIKVKKNIKLTN